MVFNRLFHHLLVTMLDLGLVFSQVYFAIQLSDLGSDYINPIDLCRDLNRFMLPEASGHALVTLLLLLFGRWRAVLVNMPMLIWNLRKFANNEFKLEPTEIFRTYNKYKREAFGKLIYYMALFFFYMFCMVYDLIVFGEPSKQLPDYEAMMQAHI